MDIKEAESANYQILKELDKLYLISRKRKSVNVSNIPEGDSSLMESLIVAIGLDEEKSMICLTYEIWWIIRNSEQEKAYQWAGKEA